MFAAVTQRIHLPFLTGPLRWLGLWQCRAGPFRQCRTKPNSKQLVKICYICPFKNKSIGDPDCCPLYRPVNTQLHPAGERQETTACGLHYKKEHKTYPRWVLENITKTNSTAPLLVQINARQWCEAGYEHVISATGHWPDCLFMPHYLPGKFVFSLHHENVSCYFTSCHVRTRFINYQDFYSNVSVYITDTVMLLLALNEMYWFPHVMISSLLSKHYALICFKQICWYYLKCLHFSVVYIFYLLFAFSTPMI